jgi:hypothetical protein
MMLFPIRIEHALNGGSRTARSSPVEQVQGRFDLLQQALNFIALFGTGVFLLQLRDKLLLLCKQQLCKGRHLNDSMTRSIAGCLRFFTFTQYGGRLARYVHLDASIPVLLAPFGRRPKKEIGADFALFEIAQENAVWPSRK